MRRDRSHGSRKPVVPIDAVSARLVLLGAIGVEGKRQCAEQAALVSKKVRERIAHEERYFPDEESRWVEPLRLWIPVSCEIDFAAVNDRGIVSAPTVSLVARRDDRAERFLRFSVCVRGLLRIVGGLGWPEGMKRPSVPKDPTSIDDAAAWAKRVVDVAMPPLLDFVDPMRETPPS